MEDKNKLDHQHDLVYDAKCPSELCDESYIDESYIAERVKDHNGREYKSQIIKHWLQIGHERVKSSDFSMIFKNLNGNKRKQKTAESLLIEILHPTLNIHDKSVPLKLFN